MQDFVAFDGGLWCSCSVRFQCQRVMGKAVTKLSKSFLEMREIFKEKGWIFVFGFFFRIAGF